MCFSGGILAKPVHPHTGKKGAASTLLFVISLSASGYIVLAENVSSAHTPLPYPTAHAPCVVAQVQGRLDWAGRRQDEHHDFCKGYRDGRNDREHGGD